MLFLVVSLNINIKFIKNQFDILEGPYKELNANWYIEFGSMIIQTMILEIPIPHMFPTFVMTITSMMRCCDRSLRCDKRKSKKLLQEDYEELYVGPEYIMDARIAQIIAVTWATFMFAPALPLLYPLCVINFTVIYWYDKWLVLRFYQTPMNYDESIIVK